MKEKIVYFIAGLFIYSVISTLIVFLMAKDMENKISYIAIFSIGMTLCETFIFSKIRNGKFGLFKKKNNTH